MAVHYRCKLCPTDHDLPLPYGEKLYFDAAATLDIDLECPTTGEAARYNKTDMMWKEEAEAETARR